MNLSSTRHLGGTVTAGSAAAGTRYASHTVRAAHTYCWMELAVFDSFPDVPSLSGTQVQGRRDLLASTTGAGAPRETSLMLQVELFDDECPQLCANFRRLCNGESATRQGQVYCFQGLTPSYRGTYFHKIIPGYCAQGGDITMRVVPGGTNSYASAGRGWLPDESKKRRHNETGLISMANNGPNSNGSQFFITTTATQERAFNGRHCCVGRVVDGLDEFMRLVAPCGDKDGRPSRYVVVVDCGSGAPPSHTFAMGTAASSGVAEEAQDVAATPEKEAEVAEALTHEIDGVPDRALDFATAEPPSAAALSASPPHVAADVVGRPADAVAAGPAAAAAECGSAPPVLKSSIKRDHSPSEKHVTYKE